MTGWRLTDMQRKRRLKGITYNPKARIQHLVDHFEDFNLPKSAGVRYVLLDILRCWSKNKVQP